MRRPHLSAGHEARPPVKPWGWVRRAANQVIEPDPFHRIDKLEKLINENLSRFGFANFGYLIQTIKDAFNTPYFKNHDIDSIENTIGKLLRLMLKDPEGKLILATSSARAIFISNHSRAFHILAKEGLVSESDYNLHQMTHSDYSNFNFLQQVLRDTGKDFMISFLSSVSPNNVPLLALISEQDLENAGVDMTESGLEDRFNFSKRAGTDPKNSPCIVEVTTTTGDMDGEILAKHVFAICNTAGVAAAVKKLYTGYIDGHNSSGEGYFRSYPRNIATCSVQDLLTGMLETEEGRDILADENARAIFIYSSRENLGYLLEAGLATESDFKLAGTLHNYLPSRPMSPQGMSL